MTSIDDLQHDLKGVSDTVLGNLSTEERIRVFAKEAADGNEEFLQQLADTAPRHEYTATDLEYLNGIKKLGSLALQARYDLQTRYQVINKLMQKRDKCVALMLLNESLSRLSRGGFDIDEFGGFDAPEHDDAEYAYGDKWPPDTSFLATKYRELWEDVPAELLVGEDTRSDHTKLFPRLGAAGSLAYPDDLSGETFDDLDRDRMPSEVHETEVRLLITLVEFRTRFYGYRIFAEEHVGVTFDEFLGVVTEGNDDPTPGHIVTLNEQICETLLSTSQDYFEAYPVVLQESVGLVEDADEENTPSLEEIEENLDARAQNFAEGIAEAVDLT